MVLLNKDRLLPADPGVRALARDLYDMIKDAPIISPHGHTDPRWYAQNEAFPDPAQLFVTPDHYVFRMLHSQGVPLEALGVPRVDGGETETDGRKIWRLFAEHYHLFRATPSRIWLDHAFETIFGFTERLSADTADMYYDRISEALQSPEMRPRALFEQFNIEVIATTESPLDDLKWHRMIRESGWGGRVITAYRPDPVVDPDFEGFAQNVETFCQLGGQSGTSFAAYLDAHRDRRAYFASFGATSTDHGHPSAATLNLDRAAAEALYDKVLAGKADAAEREAFRAQMLTEMAKLSCEDGLVMQIHPGSSRNHSDPILSRFGRDKGCDIPTRTDYVAALKPLLDAVGQTPELRVILFTLDETTYARELAPLAGVYPCLRLGPAWWFHDSFEGMWRYREMTTETAGFYNTVGFNDDTRAYLSIPARHDVARRVDAGFLANLVATGRLTEEEASEVINDLTHRLARQAYKL
ncbi:glucuronate isomerase [Thioclava electrotropha]|uniref:Uronate isomerase n=1 Tax=Thioclava electrotropha TaxID=1549850 RepID=A0ABX6YS70_9RHOB|nr:glucuronate isomerase [Thioclava electrotropha]QPZ90075.1 glucuronate isomerase [Thioclava electrotropha]